jgi:ABC-type lipoprotein export system ATPase subunit
MIGSVWNKWDLHLHSPFTNLNNNYGKSTLQEYAQAVKDAGLSLIGVTNYFYFKENELENVRAALNAIDAKTVVLGNVEFRINQPNKEGEWINIHVIFSEKISTKTINELLSKFTVTNTTADGKNIWCSEDSFRTCGVNAGEIVVEPKSLLKHLDENLIAGKDFMIAMCPNGYGGFQPDRKEGRSVAVALEIDKFSNIIFGRPRDRSFFLLPDRFESAIAKPVFNCSDAHAISQIGEKYTWVKAKPNFQGLRQSIFEPSDRVQQTDDFIERSFIKPYFRKISVQGRIFDEGDIKFSHQEILLNPNMVAIIGGRGTGKSLLLDAVFSRLGNCQGTERVRGVNVENLSITLNQGGVDGADIEFDNLTEDAYSYLHVSQGNIHSFSKDPVSLSNEIKRMLGIRLIPFDPVISNELAQILGDYRTFVEYWNAKDVNGASINKPNYQNSIIEKNTQLISTLTNPQNHALIERYQANSSAINENKAFTGRSTEIMSDLTRSIARLNEKLIEYNGFRDSLTKTPILVVDQIIQVMNLNSAAAEAKILELSRDNDLIRAEFAKQGINQDISSLLHKITEYQYAIDIAKDKLVEIDAKTKEYHRYVARRGELGGHYNSYVENMRLEVDMAFGRLQQHNPEWNEEQNNLVQHILRDINIIGTTVFDVEKFYSGLERCINRGKFRGSADKKTSDKLESTFCIQTKDDFFRLLTGQKIINIEEQLISIEEFFWKDEYFNQGGRYELINYLFSPESIKSFLYVNAEFTYKAKPVSKLSVGQRGTFYVCLKLATDPFGSPFIFDQPEDDLDNEFIVTQLVPLFNVIKKYRQVIIVTHNANLVVNSDAEQVIVAYNDGELITYSSGALEDGDVKGGEGVRAKVCSILEGGHTAFERRERKYGI